MIKKLNYFFILFLIFFLNLSYVSATTTSTFKPKSNKFYESGDTISTDSKNGKEINIVTSSSYRNEGWSLRAENNSIAVEGYAFVRKDYYNNISNYISRCGPKDSGSDKCSFVNNESNKYWLIVSDVDIAKKKSKHIYISDVSKDAKGTAGNGTTNSKFISGYYCTNKKSDDTKNRSISWDQLLSVHTSSVASPKYICDNGYAYNANNNRKDQGVDDSIIYSLSISDLDKKVFDKDKNKNNSVTLYMYLLTKIGSKYVLNYIYVPQSKINIGKDNLFNISENNDPISGKFSTGVDTKRTIDRKFLVKNKPSNFSSSTNYIIDKNKGDKGGNGFVTNSYPYMVALKTSSGTSYAYLAWFSTNGITKLIYTPKSSEVDDPCNFSVPCLGGGCSDPTIDERINDSANCNVKSDSNKLEEDSINIGKISCTSDNNETAITTGGKGNAIIYESSNYYYKLGNSYIIKAKDGITDKDASEYFAKYGIRIDAQDPTKFTFTVDGEKIKKVGDQYYIKINLTAAIGVSGTVTQELNYANEVYDLNGVNFNYVAGRKMLFSLSYTFGLNWKYLTYSGAVGNNSAYENEMKVKYKVNDGNLSEKPVYFNLNDDDAKNIVKISNNSIEKSFNNWQSVYQSVVDDGVNEEKESMSSVFDSSVLFDSSNNVNSKLTEIPGEFKIDKEENNWSTDKTYSAIYTYTFNNTYINLDNGTIEYSMDKPEGNWLKDEYNNGYYLPFISEGTNTFQFKYAFQLSLNGNDFNFSDTCDVVELNKLNPPDDTDFGGVDYRIISTTDPFPKKIYYTNWSRYKENYGFDRIEKTYNLDDFTSGRSYYTSDVSNEYCKGGYCTKIDVDSKYSIVSFENNFDEKGTNLAGNLFKSLNLERKSVLGNNHCKLGEFSDKCDKSQD